MEHDLDALLDELALLRVHLSNFDNYTAWATSKELDRLIATYSYAACERIHQDGNFW